MIDTIAFREMNPGEEQAVCDLVKQVFNEYVAPDYDQNGIDEFFRFSNANAMKERMRSDGFVLVAMQGDVLVGMLEYFPPDIIATLFVTIKRKGIATRLLNLAIEKIRAANPGLEKLIVHSSPYALPIYEKMGFIKTGGRITENGITYIPMVLELTNRDA